MTLDDQLDFKTVELPGGVPLVASTVRQHDERHERHRAAARRCCRADRLLYLSMLPQLLTRVSA